MGSSLFTLQSIFPRFGGSDHAIIVPCNGVTVSCTCSSNDLLFIREGILQELL